MNNWLLICIGVWACWLSCNGWSQNVPGETVHWNEFRGPGGTGVFESTSVPLQFQISDAAWSVASPAGHSSPVLSTDLVIVTGLQDQRLVTIALNKSDGSVAWQAIAPDVPLEPTHQAGGPASSTPCVDDGHVYVYFGSYGLLCYDLQGNQQWSKPIPTPKSLYGMSTSPVVYEDKLLLVLDDDANLPDSQVSRSQILALDKRTGAEIWQTARPLHRSSWSTPTVWKHDAGTELLVLGNNWFRSYDLADGSEKWSVSGFSRETIARPIVANGRALAAASMIGGVADEQPDPEPFWQAILHFDANQDGDLERNELVPPFTFPFRPELPVDHPGFGLPMPSDPAKRNERIDRMFASIDKNQDGRWTRDEFLGNMSFDRGKPNLIAVRPGGTGDVGESHVAWSAHKGLPEIPSPLSYRGRIYMVSDGGVLTSIDQQTGQLIYRKRLPAAGHYRSSPVATNGHIVLVSEPGMLTVVKASDDFEVVHQVDFQQPTSATPALDDSTIYVRSGNTLYAFRQDD